MNVEQAFALISYAIICIGNCIIIYEFLAEKIPVWRKRNDKSKQP